jgi:hypothetical protein
MPLTLPTGTVLTDAEVWDICSAYLRKCPAVIALYDATNEGPHDRLQPIDLLSLNALNAFGKAPPMTPMTEAWEARPVVEAATAEITRTDLENSRPVRLNWNCHSSSTR